VKRDEGFSLVEVMCAMLILGIALVALVQGVNAALISSKESEVQTTAALFAAGKIEDLRSVDSFIEDGTTEGDCGQSLARCQWRQIIASTPIDGLHDIKVVVENSETGKQIFELRTMLFDPPLAAEEPDAGKNGSKRKENKQG
jgi:prepilin-type N-terminal cleavage/methylation domain-containing protein